jgi:drug/metabolite transporter (DMT)-like permease
MDRSRLLGYIFSFTATLAYSAVTVMGRWGVRELASPITGATISLITGTLLMSLITVRNTNIHLKGSKKGFIFFAIAGLLSAVGAIGFYSAVRTVDAIVAGPILASNAFITIAVVRVVLQRLERVTLRLILSSVLIVGGGLLITMNPF